MKEVKVIQARSFKCIDNPSNVLVFVKYYATGEKTVAYGMVFPTSFFYKVQTDLSQVQANPMYSKQMTIGQDDKYLVSYGDDKCMTYAKFLTRLQKWAAKTKPLQGSGYEESLLMDSTPIHTIDILNKSESYKFKQFKAA